MVNCSMNWTWVAWIPGPRSWQMQPARLLAKYHDVFSLDQAELDCTHSMEHIIKVTDEYPYLRNGLDEFHHYWLRRLGII